jgi:uncharacterized repeat protein (TIGR01451 family)
MNSSASIQVDRNSFPTQVYKTKNVVARSLYFFVAILLAWSTSTAQTPIALYNNFTGKVDFTIIGGTLRSQSNTVNACSVNPSSSYTLTLPSGATLLAAYLYWAGSYSTANGSTQLTPDYSVTLDGNAETATRTFTLNFVNGGTTYPFFSGFVDVTSYVAPLPNNHSFTFSGLSVNTGSPHCDVQAVVSAWAMVCVYSLPTQPRHSINIFDGFNYFYGSQITFNPNNFHVPSSYVDGKLAHITYEGDAENSGTLNGISENLYFNGNVLSDAINPVNNQFNSASSLLTPSTNTYGLDIDRYSVSSYLHAGDTSAVSTYASGADFVLLNCEVISISDTSSADVQLTKTHSGGASIAAGSTTTFTLSALNNGPDTTGTITVTDSLPTGAQFVSYTGSGWSIDSSAKPKFVWNHTGNHAPGVALPNIVVTVLLSEKNYPTLYNTATISSPLIDRRPWNNTAKDSITILSSFFTNSTKTVTDLNGGQVQAKDTLLYTIKVKNSGNYAAPNVVVVDTMPSGIGIVSSTIQPGGTVSGNVLTFNTIASIAIGDSTTLTYRAVVDSSVVGGQTITNVAHMRAMTIDQKVTASVTPVNVPAMSIVKTSLPGWRRANDTITYRIVVKDGSTITQSTGTQVLDTIPTNMTYVTGSANLSGVFSTPPAGGRLAWSLGTLTGGTIDTLTFKAIINNGTAVNTVLKNTARLSNNQGSAVSSTVNDTVRQYTTGIITATATINPGNTIYYTLTDADLNTNTTKVETYTLKDSSSTGETENLTFTETGQNTGVFTASVPTIFGLTKGTNNDGIFNAKAGDTITIIYNDANTNNGTAARTTAITVVKGGATATLTATSLIHPGDTVYYSLTDADLNKNPLTSESYTIKDSSKTGEIENLTFTETGPNTGIFTAKIPTVYGAIAGANNDGKFNAKAGDTLILSYFDSLQANGGSGVFTVRTTVRGGVTATISASPSIIAAGNSITFTVTDNDLNRDTTKIDTLKNNSVSTTGEVELLNFIESGKNTGIFVAVLPTVAGTTPGPNNNGVMTVKPGDTVSVTYFDSLTATGSTATIKAYTVVGQVNFSQSAKTFVDVNGGLHAPHDSLRYTILVKNSGTVGATNVSVQDTVPTGITIVPGSITGGGSLTANIITFTAFNLAVNDSLILQFVATIDTTVVDSSSVTNKAVIAANGVTQLVSVSFTASNRPVMTLAKTVDKTTPTVGDTVTYTISYSNVGTGKAASVVVTDTIPAHTTYIPNSVLLNGSSQTDIIDADPTQVVGVLITVNLNNVAVGQNGTIKYKLKIN